ncbi:uncharacterized protein LOC121413039 [Lytechinus variegatus]|uniref:uncharacterized protein LOC121413039 n=1 Tax=Lytechinus variegatus TaxID=7654 RepID=UPI001BB19E54|nr:uncharacterized protein LOC121413039 [Lytechinus variegatus]
MAYRSSQHEATGYTPSELMIGRQMILPVDLLIGSSGTPESSYPEFTEQLQDRMNYTHQLTRERLRVNTDRNKRTYDTHKAGEGHQQGDAVWLHTKRRKKGISPKLQRSWTGPFFVIDALSDVTYRIQETSKSKPKVVHFNRLKMYVGAPVPNWALKKIDDKSLSSATVDASPEEHPQTQQDPQSQEESSVETGARVDISSKEHDCPTDTDRTAEIGTGRKKRLSSEVAAISKSKETSTPDQEPPRAKEQKTGNQMLTRRSKRLRKTPSRFY